MQQLSLSEVLNNQHFNQYAAILSTAMNRTWRSRHPEVPSVRGTLDRFSRLVKTAKLSDSVKKQFLTEFLSVYLAIVDADMRLLHRQEDMDWLIEVIDRGGVEMVMVFSAMFAVASARRQIFSLEQVAEANSLNEGTLKNKAARGEFVGAFKVAETNRWIFSEVGLLAQGLKIPQEPEREAKEMEHEMSVRLSHWVGAEGRLFERVCLVFESMGYIAPTPDATSDGPATGAYASNIEVQYRANFTADKVLQIIEFAKAHSIEAIKNMASTGGIDRELVLGERS